MCGSTSAAIRGERRDGARSAEGDGQWSRAKGFDTFCPVGPIVTDEVDAIDGALTVTTTLNGETKQSGSTRDMIFPVAELAALHYGGDDAGAGRSDPDGNAGGRGADAGGRYGDA